MAEAGRDGSTVDEDAEAGPVDRDAEPADRIDRLLARAREERRSFEPPDDPDERALTYLREGLWPTIETYVEGRTGEFRRFERAEWDRLETSLHAWLSLYARCYGERVDPDVPVRIAAETFLDTYDLRATAELLTGVAAGDEGHEPTPERQ
ncbi:hypothetical protein [Natronoarchaeum philippinense]|uniref:hypothetical protein n=1 Tax=Natronoarchaeum philippinense TaxID=558529 RepID=UPI001FE6E615|nr:hypothetical protein [Natronoarchaeum philippinense]